MEGRGKFALVGAEYVEYHPETLQGFFVKIDDEPKVLFEDLMIAIFFATSEAEQVGYSSSLDQYKSDLRKYGIPSMTRH